MLTFVSRPLAISPISAAVEAAGGHLSFEPIGDVASAVRSALDQVGAGATLCVLPQGPQTIPYLARGD